MYALQLLPGDSFTLQLIANRNPLAQRADHTQVANLRSQRPAQNAHVVAMPARGDHHKVALVGCEPGASLIEILGINFTGLGKALAIGVGLTVIDHDHIKSCQQRNFIGVHSHVSGAEQIKQGRW